MPHGRSGGERRLTIASTREFVREQLRSVGDEVIVSVAGSTSLEKGRDVHIAVMMPLPISGASRASKMLLEAGTIGSFENKAESVRSVAVLQNDGDWHSTMTTRVVLLGGSCAIAATMALGFFGGQMTFNRQLITSVAGKVNQWKSSQLSKLQRKMKMKQRNRAW